MARRSVMESARSLDVSVPQLYDVLLDALFEEFLDGARIRLPSYEHCGLGRYALHRVNGRCDYSRPDTSGPPHGKLVVPFLATLIAHLATALAALFRAGWLPLLTGKYSFTLHAPRPTGSTEENI